MTIFLFPPYDVSALFTVVCEGWVDKTVKMNICDPYWWSVKLTGALSRLFPYVMRGNRSLPIRIWLILKSTHETG